jgi:hypothetical protein
MNRRLTHRLLLLLVAIFATCAAGCPRSSGTAVWIDEGEVADLRKSLGAGAAGKTEAVAAAEPTGFATIKGTFKLDGTPPARKPLGVNKDQDICMPGGKEVLGEELVVDANGGIKDVVIYCVTKMPSEDPKWIHPDYAATKEAPVEFDQKNCVFLTHMLAVRSTQPVILKNSDPKGHNANIVAKGKALGGNFLIPAGSTSRYLAGGESPEPFDVSCNIHPWMSAKMLVRDNPIFAVTKADGSFEIKNVPAGVPLDFKVWQESSKFMQSVKLNGKAAKWPKGKISLKDKDILKPDEQRTLDVTVDAASFAK